jgi:uncharacterized repeat protein (TIGR02543 family)
MVTFMKNRIASKRLTALLLLVCMMISLFSRSFSVHAEDKELRPDGSLPVIYLNIDESQGTIEDMIASDDHSAYCYGTLSIEVPEGFRYSDYQDVDLKGVEGLAMNIRGRGNSTWQRSAKKAFKIKLDKKADLFGFGKNKHWVLLANALDETLLRDRITAWLGDQLDFEFTPRGVPVDLVLRGEEYGDRYIGSYYFSENVRVDDNRLEIDELSEEDTEEPTITGGYLLQHGLQVKSWSPDKFFTERGVSWATHTPSFDVEGDNLAAGEEQEPVPEENYAGAELGDAYENPVQQKYIQDYIQMTEDTIFEGGTAYRDLFDLRSAALYWWVQSVSINADAYGTGSYYIYKKRDTDGVPGKIFTGPLWDFDFAWDNHSVTSGFEVPHKWLVPMFCDKEEGGLLDEIKKSWPLVRENVAEMVRDGGLIDQYYEETKTSAALDRQIWHPTETDFDYKAEVDELKQWIKDRLDWIDANFSELDNAAHTVTFMADGEVMEVRYISDGGRMDTDAKAPEKEGYVFLGWEDEDGELAGNTVNIRKDTVFTAKYLSDEEATHATDIAMHKSSDVVLYNPNVSRYLVNWRAVPDDAQDQVIAWSSSNESYATIDNTGTISYNGPGTVTVTAKLRSGKERQFTLYVIDTDELPVPESIRPEEETIYMQAGEKKPLYITTEPEPAKINSYLYEAEDEDIVSVDYYSVITALKPGKTVIHVTSTTNGEWPDRTERETEVTVIVSEKKEGPQRLWFSSPSYTIRAGQDFVLIAHDEPEGSAEKITFTSSDPKIVSNEGNLLKGMKPGYVTMTAAAENGVSAICEVKVLFDDVPESGKYYSSPVYWAVNKGITNGYTDADGIIRTFRPQNTCTREAMVTFLWRLAGCPEPKSLTPKFSDVKEQNRYYYKAVQWAAEQGITNGYSDGTFRPYDTVSRKDTMIMLYRYEGKPPVSGTLIFPDAIALGYGPGTDTYKSIVWGTNLGITKGYSDGTFRPLANCLREHIVTFIFRYVHSFVYPDDSK